MRVLYLVTRNRHTHDFGVDFLYHGLCSILGAENVFAWPEPDSLHADSPFAPCPTCEHGPYDSDQSWPRKNHSLAEAIAACDVAIIATQAGDSTLMDPVAVGRARSPQPLSAVLAELWHKSKPIVGVDTGDGTHDASCYYRSVAGRALQSYFKRETPLGAHWAIPLPLGYPAARIPQPFPEVKGGVFYHASLHGADARCDSPGIPRNHIANELALRFRSNRAALDLNLYATAAERLQPDEYHERMKNCLVGVSWNGFPYCMNWDNNRFWENFAFGLAQVAERPRIRIPYEPVDGVHCIYVDSIDEVGKQVEALASDPQRAIQMAGDGLRHFVKYHSSEARARYLLSIVTMLG